MVGVVLRTAVIPQPVSLLIIFAMLEDQGQIKAWHSPAGIQKERHRRRIAEPLDRRVDVVTLAVGRAMGEELLVTVRLAREPLLQLARVRE